MLCCEQVARAGWCAPRVGRLGTQCTADASLIESMIGLVEHSEPTCVKRPTQRGRCHVSVHARGQPHSTCQLRPQAAGSRPAHAQAAPRPPPWLAGAHPPPRPPPQPRPAARRAAAAARPCSRRTAWPAPAPHAICFQLPPLLHHPAATHEVLTTFTQKPAPAPQVTCFQLPSLLHHPCCDT